MRKYTYLICTAALLAGGAISGADEITFIACATPNCGCPLECAGFWDLGSSWQGGEVPGPNDVAYIPEGHKAIVRDIQGGIDPVGAVKIDPHDDPEDLAQHTRIIVGDGATLPIASSTYSLVNGTLNVADGGTLQMNADHTIKGDGDILLEDNAVIGDDNGGGEILTISPNTGCSPLARSCAIVLWSELGGEVRVGLVNDAYVVASRPVSHTEDACENIVPTLQLTTNVKTGSGYWIAEEDGHLKTTVEVKGDGTWVIEDWTVGCHKIIIDACCDEVTGDVQLSEGEFIVSANGYFCTTGDAYLDGSAPQRGADLVSYSGRTAAFGNVSCSCPQ